MAQYEVSVDIPEPATEIPTIPSSPIGNRSKSKRHSHCDPLDPCAQYLRSIGYTDVANDECCICYFDYRRKEYKNIQEVDIKNEPTDK